ncbi:MAG: SAM-dependent chlorinase/fluorinase [Chromatiales bacterium]|jgi:S-adenosylmethionine hydrolase
MNRQPVYLFTDFGGEGPYLAQLESQFLNEPQLQTLRLLNNAPATDAYHSAYLLAALYRNLPVKSGYLLAVVDPGVGSQRDALLVTVGDMHIIAPDNGLLSRLMAEQGIQQAGVLQQPDTLASDSFHARDWFTPALLRHCHGEDICSHTMAHSEMVGHDWPSQLNEIIYIDVYGNLFTGLPANSASTQAVLKIAGHDIGYARVFDGVAEGQLFWYRNSSGQVEIAANRASAAELLQAGIGDHFDLA